VRREAQTLADAGHQLTVIAPRGGNEVTHEIIEHVQVIRYPALPDGEGVLAYASEFIYVTFATTLLVLWIWLRQGLDVLHVHNPPDTLFVAGLLPRLFGKTFIYDHHDLAPELYLAKFQKDGGFVYGILRLLEKWTCKTADHIVEVNESYMRSDMERNRVNEDKTIIVRNAPALSSLNPPTRDEKLAHRAKIVAGYLGHIAKQDGVDHMVKALHYAQEACGFDDWYAVIIGPGKELESLKQLASDLGITDKIWFTGFLANAEWREKLNSVDICFVPDPVNPLNERSTMMKMMDYMALGKPIVAYDMIENRVSGGDAALYARPGEHEDLALQFIRLAEDPSLRQRLGERGRQRMQDHLAWEFSAQHLIDLYDKLMSRVKTNAEDRA
jgi:glycosyltransferase involved in cell wall biosynthesis